MILPHKPIPLNQLRVGEAKAAKAANAANTANTANAAKAFASCLLLLLPGLISYSSFPN